MKNENDPMTVEELARDLSSRLNNISALEQKISLKNQELNELQVNLVKAKEGAEETRKVLHAALGEMKI